MREEELRGIVLSFECGKIDCSQLFHVFHPQMREVVNLGGANFGVVGKPLSTLK